MARPWRLRHKLGLGLALVVGSVALLLGGALFGLSSYVDTMQVTQRKLDEMQIVIQLRDHIHRIASAGQINRPETDATLLEREKGQILEASRDARQTLAIYRDILRNETLRRGLDPDQGDNELKLTVRLDDAFVRLEDAVAQATLPQASADPTARLTDDPRVRAAYAELHQSSTDLFLYLVSDVKESFDRSNANHRRSLYIAGTATALAVVFVLTLLYYFRVWVFAPIKQLQAGVHRVHSGDFDHPIRLTSQDELEELADEFNAMTTRLRDIYKDLAQQVNERTRQLVRSERMVSVGFLAAGVAHEINNPLASIAFCAEALERRLHEVLNRAPEEAEVILKYLKMMQQEAFRCKQITQKLLDFSRTGGKQEPTDMTQLVQDVIEVAQVLPTARGKQIIYQPEGRPIAPVRVPEVKGVVLNIVVNALESMEEGGHLTVAVHGKGDRAELTFTDTGCGMTAEVLENIFEPFFTRSRTGNGTGLGLATSHLIIDQHGGTIAATSRGPGQGSTFTVRLPLYQADARRDARPESSEGAVHPAVVPFPAARSAA